MRIIERLIPISNKFTRPGISMSPEWVTVHETSNYSKGANAEAHANLQYHGNPRQASWHFTSGSDGIYQSIPTNEVAYHAGDGAGDGNTKSIGIEICVNQDGDFEKAKDKAVWLIRKMMDKYNIPIGNVVPHKHWTGKDCPHKIISSGWETFIARIEGGEDVPEGAKEPNPPYVGSYVRKGSKGCSVKLIQLKLGGLVVDGMFGPNTEARVRVFQRENSLSADGIVGPNTWGGLFS